MITTKLAQVKYTKRLKPVYSLCYYRNITMPPTSRIYFFYSVQNSWFDIGQHHGGHFLFIHIAMLQYCFLVTA